MHLLGLLFCISRLNLSAVQEQHKPSAGHRVNRSNRQLENMPEGYQRGELSSGTKVPENGHGDDS